jgi:hypothetical protein
VDAVTDLNTHHIEGYARAAMEQGLNGHFRVPLISEVLPGLWQGGCLNGVELPPHFDLVVSLYPWEQYALAPRTRRLEIKAYDAAEVPDLAEAVNAAYDAWKLGEDVLIHCQAGLNRSGLVAAQVLMRDGYTAQDAIAKLRDSRCPLVLCNQPFELWLLAQE